MVDELERDWQGHEGRQEGIASCWLRAGLHGISGRNIAVRVVIDWHRLCREDVAASPLEVFKTKSEQPGLAGSVPEHGRGGTGQSLKNSKSRQHSIQGTTQRQGFCCHMS